MADSKYADLPGIAYDQVDVYETTDLPESEQFQVYSEDEGDSIEKIYMSATQAFNKFKGKQVDATAVDFSDRISRKAKSGYKFGSWELSGEGEKETPIQKYQRLKCEIKDLFDEVQELEEKVKDEDGGKSTTDIVSQVEAVSKQLDSLKLEECLGPELIATLSDPQGTRFKQLISQIELFKETNVVPAEEKKALIQSKQESSDTGVLKYQMLYLPEKARMQELARIAQLEQRLCTLENLVGIASDKVPTFAQLFKCQGITEAVQQLGSKATLLDVNQLDVIEKMLASLVQRMDTVAQKKSTLLPDSEQEQKIGEIYDIMKKTETISEVLPQTVNRMLVLSSVHKEAAEFNRSLARLDELQAQITTSLESNKCALQDVQHNFASNLEIIKNNITSLDERVTKLTSQK